MARHALKCIAEAHGDDWALYNGDAVELARQLPDRSIDLAIYSPPFSNLYCYSDSERDMGNCADDAEFFEHYRFLLTELYRSLRPGRLAAVHCKDLVNYKGRDGKAGLRDFPGDIIRAHEAAGFAWHSRVTIWKSPVTEMQKTKAHGLLYKQLRKDSTFSRQGMAEYILTFRKWPDSEAEEADIKPVSHTPSDFTLNQWQEWASPVWMNVDATDVLNVQLARDDKDEKHMCPLSLDIIERCLVLYSNPGEVVLSPFAGVGSEGVGSVQRGRKFVGFELKPTYFDHAVRHLKASEKSQLGLFGRASGE